MSSLLNEVRSLFWHVEVHVRYRREKVHVRYLITCWVLVFITSPAGAATKYCNEQVFVCVSMCLSVRQHISRTARAIFTIFRMLSMAVIRFSTGRVWQGDEIPRGKEQFWAFSSNWQYIVYSIAFGTHTKMAKPIAMPFGMMTRVGPRYHVLDGGPDLPSWRSNFGAKRNGQL